MSKKYQFKPGEIRHDLFDDDIKTVIDYKVNVNDFEIGERWIDIAKGKFYMCMKAGGRKQWAQIMGAHCDFEIVENKDENKVVDFLSDLKVLMEKYGAYICKDHNGQGLAIGVIVNGSFEEIKDIDYIDHEDVQKLIDERTIKG